MKRLIIGDCTAKSRFASTDQEAISEVELEARVVKALTCAFPNYHCFVFGGTFTLEGVGYRPDLAMVARDHSHWFVIEVELTSHSFDLHVLPQVRAFQYGRPESDCARKLASDLGIDLGQAELMLRQVPRSVAVIANRRSERWETALAALNVQLLVLSVYRSSEQAEAIELEGDLDVVSRSLGFGVYTATDRSIRFPIATSLPLGLVEMYDRRKGSSMWSVSATADTKWVTKQTGTPDIEDGSFVQLILAVDGRFLLRSSR